MEFVENIKIDEYEDFVRNSSKSHFMQSYYFGNVMKAKNYTPYYVGLKDNGQLIATALLLRKRLFKGLYYYYCPRGYVLNYDDLQLVGRFTKEIKKYAKKNHAIFVKIDPDVKRHDLDSDGNILGHDHYDLINKLLSLGYVHKGFNVDFVNEQPRFTFRLNLEDDFDKIYSRMHATTRKILNKKNQYNLDTYIGNINDINDFYITMHETAQRENLGCNPISYYERFYSILNEQGMSDLYVVKVHMNELRHMYKTKMDDLLNKIEYQKEHPLKNAQKNENKIKEFENEYNKLNKDMDIIKDIKEEELVLSSIITVKYGDKVWTVHGGNTTKLRFLNSNYWLYYTIIKDAYDQGYKTIDFFGTSGLANPPKDSPIFGIHLFKKRLGGEYNEFIGEFDLVTSPLMYYLYNLIIPLRRKIIKARLRKNNKD